MVFLEIIKAFIQSVKHAIEGIGESVRVEKNLKIHLFISVFVLIAGMVFNISGTEWMVIVLCMGIVIGLELLNTSIEYAVDLACDKQYHELAKKAKDASAGAVLVVAFMSVIIGMIIFVPKLWSMLFLLIN